MFDVSMTRRSFATAVGAGAMAALVGCGGAKEHGTGALPDGPVKAVMITSTGGIADQPFNELAWKAMQQLESDNGWDVSYIAEPPVQESEERSNYTPNIMKAIDQGATFIWGIGYALEDDINAIAEEHPEVTFALIDATNDRNLENLTGVMFHAEQCSFVVGYIAARVSESGKVGFLGGMTSTMIQAFEYGFYAGVVYANSELGKSVTYEGKYAESFSDFNKGSSLAQQMIKDGCDVLYQAAGGTGLGLLKACSDADVWCIGVDQDQAAMYPDYTTIITSALKRVDTAMIYVSNGLADATILGGDNLTLGAIDDAIGIASTHDRLDKIDDKIYPAALELIEKIKEGEIIVPDNKKDFEEYVKTV